MMTNNYLPHVGGVAHSVHTFSEGYRELGHEVLVVAPTYEGDDAVPASIERNVVRLPAIQRFNGSDFSMRLPLTWLLDPKLNAFQPDIVHSHHPYVLGDSALRYAADKNAPVIFTHHTLHEEYTHYVPFDSPTFKQFVIELCTKYANLCDAVIAPSESIAELIQARGVVAPVEIIPTGIDVSAFGGGRRELFRDSYDLSAGTFVVGHVGRLAPEKHLEYLGDAVARFLKMNASTRFLVIGEGPSAMTLRARFDEAGLADRLIMPGQKTGIDLRDAYAAMDVFAFSSLTETQGLVLIEAMATGLPVVALDASGVREVVLEGENGLLLDSEIDPATFALRLQSVQQNPGFRKHLSAGARKTAREFSVRSSADKALDLYQRVLSRTRRQRAQTENEAFGTLLRRLQVEWALIAQKAEAVIGAVAGTNGSTHARTA